MRGKGSKQYVILGFRVLTTSVGARGEVVRGWGSKGQREQGEQGGEGARGARGEVSVGVCYTRF